MFKTSTSQRFSKIDCVFYPNCEKGDLCPFAHNRIINNQKIKSYSHNNSEKYNKNYRHGNNNNGNNNGNNNLLTTKQTTAIKTLNKKISNYTEKSERNLKKTFNNLNLQRRESNNKRRNSITTTATNIASKITSNINSNLNINLNSKLSSSTTIPSTTHHRPQNQISTASTTTTTTTTKLKSSKLSNNVSINKNLSTSSPYNKRDKKEEDYKRYKSNKVSSSYSSSSSILSSSSSLQSSTYYSLSSSSSSSSNSSNSSNSSSSSHSSSTKISPLQTTSRLSSSYLSNKNLNNNNNKISEKRKDNVTPGSIPKIIPTAISKIPRDVRQKMAITFFNEFQRIYEPILKIDPDLARQHSLDQEKALYDKSNKKTYKISATHILSHLKARKLATSIQDVGIDGIWKPFSLQKKETQEGINDAELEVLKTYLIKKEEFKLLNYPTEEQLIAYNNRNKKEKEEKEEEEKKKENMSIINNNNNKNNNSNISNGNGNGNGSGNDNGSKIKLTFSSNKTKICSRCQCSYIPKRNEDIPLLTEAEKEACTFHYGKLRRTSSGHSSKRIYSCCQGEIGSKGCTKGPHVWKCESFDTLNESIPFTQLPKPSNLTNNDKNILKVAALDCEMSYTTGGLELTRITVVNWKGDVVMDELCKPHNCIIDLNTRYSGIKELDSVTIDLDGIKEKMSKIMNRNTIIIGQGLENDFNALRLIHDKVIDTVLLYPHPMGLPIKYGLRYLANKYLKRFIQEGVDGHDSFEDSKTCIDLVKMKMENGKDFGIV